MHVKLLVDEDLSPSVAAALRADGIDACHIRDRDMLGAKGDIVNRVLWVNFDGTMEFEDIPPA